MDGEIGSSFFEMIMGLILFVENHPFVTAVLAGVLVAAIVAFARFVRNRLSARDGGVAKQGITIKGKGNLINIVDADAIEKLARENDIFDTELSEEAPKSFRETEFDEYAEVGAHFVGRVYVSHGHRAKSECDEFGLRFDMDPYILHIRVTYYIEDEEGDKEITVYGEEESARIIGVLNGSIIFGRQMFDDGADFYIECDTCSGDLEAIAGELISNDLVYSEDGTYRNVLCIDSIELSSDMIESDGIHFIFNGIPQMIYEEYNIKPDILCYLVATSKGYYDKSKEKANLDPRSVDVSSPLLFLENGFEATTSKRVLCRVTEQLQLPIYR